MILGDKQVYRKEKVASWLLMGIGSIIQVYYILLPGSQLEMGIGTIMCLGAFGILYRLSRKQASY